MRFSPDQVERMPEESEADFYLRLAQLNSAESDLAREIEKLEGKLSGDEKAIARFVELAAIPEKAAPVPIPPASHWSLKGFYQKQDLNYLKARIETNSAKLKKI